HFMPYLEAGAVQQSATTVQIPKGLPAGTYFIGVCIGGADGEMDVLNCSTVPIEIATDLSNDLQLVGFNMSTDSGNPGTLVSVSFDVQNAGNTVTPNFQNTIRWSTDASTNSDDLELRRIGWGSLNGGERLNAGPFTIEILYSAAAGTYYIGICTDSLN